MASPSKGSGFKGEDEKENKAKEGKFIPTEEIQEEADSSKIIILPSDIEAGWDRISCLIFKKSEASRLTLTRLNRFTKIGNLLSNAKTLQKRFAIELYLENSVLNQLFSVWRTLENNLIQNIHFIEIKSSRFRKTIPRITLFSTPSADPLKLEKIIETISLNKDAIPLSLSSISPLPNDKNNILFLTVTPSDSLVQFHFQLCELLNKEGIEIGDEYRPENWIPICPIAKKVPNSRILEAKMVSRAIKLPINGYLNKIRLVEFPPDIREVFDDVKKEAILLFKKQISPTDAMLNRFSITKKEAEDYFPGLQHGKSVDITVYDADGKRWLDMVLTRYMSYTYYIGTDWKMLTRYMHHFVEIDANGNNRIGTIWTVKVQEPKMKLVAGTVIKFFKLRRDDIFVFPYQYMIRF